MIGKQKKLALTTRGREEDEEEQEGELGETGSGRGRRLPALFCLEPIVHQILSNHSAEGKIRTLQLRLQSLPSTIKCQKLRGDLWVS